MFVAGIEEQRKRMRISRFSFEVAKDETFTFDQVLTTATISPPAPFSGTATFQRSPSGAASWTGSLAVTLPGTAKIPLVGADFRPRLYRVGEDGIAHPGP